MENPILDHNLGTVPSGKLYKDRSLWVATFFGGPLAAGYILAENFKSLGKTSTSRNTWIYTILITILLFVAVFNIPDNIPFPNQIIPIISILVANWILTNSQGKQINRHVEAGGEVYSTWRGLLIGVICLLITLTVVIGVFFVADLMITSEP